MHAAPNPLLARLLEAARRSATSAAVLIAPDLGETAADWARLERALKRQEIAEEAAHVGTFEADLETEEITISREIARLHDRDPESLVLSNEQFLSSVHPEDQDRLLGLVGRRDDFTVDYRYLCPDGLSTRIFEISGRWLSDDRADHPGYFVGVERDVTEQRAQETQLRQLALHDALTGTLNRRGFEQLLARYAVEHAVPEAGCLLMIDLDDFKHHNDTYGHAVGDAILVAIATAVQERLGPAEAIGRIGGDEFVVLLPEHSAARAVAVADELRATIARATEQVSPDPEHPVTASIGVAAFTEDEDPTLVLRRADEAMYTAKSAGGNRSARWTKHQPPADRRHAVESADAEPAGVDPVTGLPGRRGLLAQAEQRLAGADTSGTTPGLTAYVIDICGLELLDQETVPIAREGLVGELAARFAAHSGGKAAIGLLGECRLAAVLPVPDEAALEAITADVLHCLEEPYFLRGTAAVDAAVMPMVGVATWTPGINAFTLLQNAIIAVTAARISGPGSVHRYDPVMRERARDRATAHVALRRAIARQEFHLLFQPGLHLPTNRFTRAEALVRWRPTVGSATGPDTFVPLAESTGLILPLGEQILDLSIAQAQRWQDQLPDVLISVNISAVELSTPSFAERMIARIEEAGLGPGRFAFEVTESALMQNLTLGRRALQRLVDAGYRVVIDDFGSGYSSLARLSEIPTMGIKIDMSLVLQLTADPAARTVLGAIVDVGRAYGLAVTAEGIEDAETLRIVRDLGVDYAQGYYLSRPRPADELTDLLARPWSDIHQTVIR